MANLLGINRSIVARHIKTYKKKELSDVSALIKVVIGKFCRRGWRRGWRRDSFSTLYC